MNISIADLVAGTRVFGDPHGIHLTMVNYTLHSRGFHFDLLLPEHGLPEVQLLRTSAWVLSMSLTVDDGPLSSDPALCLGDWKCLAVSTCSRL